MRFIKHIIRKLGELTFFFLHILKIFILFLIVVFFFCIRLPIYIFRLLYNVFSFKKSFESLDNYFDIHTYDPRFGYVQYVDKGFSFLGSSSIKYRLTKKYTYYIYLNKYLFAYKPIKYFLLVFKRIFVIQKVQVFYFLYYIGFFIFKRKYIKFCYYVLMTGLRLLLGEGIVRFFNGELKKRTRIFIILIKQFLSHEYLQDLILLLKLKWNYLPKKRWVLIKLNTIKFKIKYIKLISYMQFLKLSYKLRLILNFVLLKIGTFFIYKIVLKIVKKLFIILSLIYILLLKYIKKKLMDDNKLHMESLSKLYIYKFEIFSLGFLMKRNTMKINLDIMESLLNENKIKIGDIKAKLKPFKFRNIMFLYILYKIYKNIIFLNLKTISLTIINSFKTYKDGLSFHLNNKILIVVKNLFRNILEGKLEFNFENLNLFGKGDNLFYSFLQDHKLVGDSRITEKEKALNYFDGSIDFTPIKDFYINLFYKPVLNYLRKRLVLKKKFMKCIYHEFSYKSLIFLKYTSSFKEFIAFLYDKYYIDIVRNYNLYNFINNDIIKVLLKYIKEDFNKMKIVENDIFKFFVYLSLKDYDNSDADEFFDEFLENNLEDDLDDFVEEIIMEKKKIKDDLKKSYKFYEKFKIDNKLKRLNAILFDFMLGCKEKIDYLFTIKGVFENSFFFFSGVKRYGFYIFDLKLLDDKLFEFINMKYERLLTSDFFYSNSILKKFNLKLIKGTDSNFFYKLKDKDFMLFLSDLFKLNNTYLIFNKIFEKYGFSFSKKKLKPIKYVSIFKDNIKKHPLILSLKLLKLLKMDEFKFEIKMKLSFIKLYLQQIIRKSAFENLKKDRELKDDYLYLNKNKNLFLDPQLEFDNIHDILSELFLFNLTLNKLKFRNLLYLEYLSLKININKYKKNIFKLMVYCVYFLVVKAICYFLLFICTNLLKFLIKLLIKKK